MRRGPTGRLAATENGAPRRSAGSESAGLAPRQRRLDSPAATPQPLIGLLRRHQTIQARDRAAGGVSWQDTGHVFTTSLGTPIEPRNVNRHFDSWCELTGVRRIRFHDLRHSCASLLYSLGVPLDQIQDVLGHGSPVTTKLIYVDVAEGMRRDALDQLGALFEEDDDE